MSKKKSINIIDQLSFWTNVCIISIWGTLVSLLKTKWYITLIYSLIAAIIAFVLFCRVKRSIKESDIPNKKVRSALKNGKKKGDISGVYKVIFNEILPALRKEFPTKIYKYYSLGDDSNINQRKFDTLSNNKIWSSIYSEFNDPFECQYMYLEENDFIDIGFPKETKILWDLTMKNIRERITTICFTQNPNNMPMWAHYANEHKGFCVEYEIVDSKNLYPVLYAKQRIKTQGLFVQLFCELFCKDTVKKSENMAFKQIMLLSAYKDDSWSAEKEIRAIFLNSKVDMKPKGRICSCEEIGVKPTKIFIGVNCESKNSKKLQKISQDLGIDFENCSLSTGKEFSVISSKKA